MFKINIDSSVAKFFQNFAYLCIFNLLCFSVYAYLDSKKPQLRFATVDLAGLINKNREKWQAELISNKNSEETQKILIERIQKFGAKADESILKLQEKCSCTILIKQAVISPASQVPDLTSVLSVIIEEVK